MVGPHRDPDRRRFGALPRSRRVPVPRRRLRSGSMASCVGLVIVLPPIRARAPAVGRARGRRRGSVVPRRQSARRQHDADGRRSSSCRSSPRRCGGAVGGSSSPPAIPLALWMVLPGVATAGHLDDPAAEADYHAPVIEVVTQAGGQPGRVEVPFTAGHWEVAHIASEVPIARGWERQVDMDRNADALRRGAHRRASTASGSTSTPCGGSRCPMSSSTRVGRRKLHCSSVACRGCGSSGRPSTGASGRSSTPTPIVDPPAPARERDARRDRDRGRRGRARSWCGRGTCPTGRPTATRPATKARASMSSDDGLLEVVVAGTRAGAPATRVLPRSAAHRGVRRRVQLRRLRTAAGTVRGTVVRSPLTVRRRLSDGNLSSR